MKYVIMCGGKYDKWEEPKHLTKINGEPIVARTIRLLKANGVEDIAISSNDARFAALGVPLLKHRNPYHLPKDKDAKTPWLDAFYPMTDPVCYIFGDVVFSPRAIQTLQPNLWQIFTRSAGQNLLHSKWWILSAFSRPSSRQRNWMKRDSSKDSQFRGNCGRS